MLFAAQCSQQDLPGVKRLQCVQSNVVDTHPSISGSVGGMSFVSSSSLGQQTSRLAAPAALSSIRTISEGEEGESASANAPGLVSVLLVCQANNTVAVSMRPHASISSPELLWPDCVLPPSTCSLTPLCELSTEQNGSTHAIEEAHESHRDSEHNFGSENGTVGERSAYSCLTQGASSQYPGNSEKHRCLGTEPAWCNGLESASGDSERSRRVSGTGTDDTVASSGMMPVVSLRGVHFLPLPVACHDLMEKGLVRVASCAYE
jgi:hypothetical protein